MSFLHEPFKWLEWSNPVALWWIFLASVSLLNILVWIFTYLYFSKRPSGLTRHLKIVLSLSGVYVFVCAFRSLLPRADVQRICLYDTWFSSVLVGRSVATVAELCFVGLWAWVLNHLAKMTDSKNVERISLVIVPLITVAECFSWYAVITTHYLGNTFEESIWAITYCLIAVGLVLLLMKFKGALKYITAISVVGCLLYVLFMVTVDVPMYLGRWKSDSASGKQILNLMDGFHDLNTRWVVTHSISDWKTEIPWMSLYFSLAVWTSLALCFVPESKERLAKYLR